MPDTDTTTPSLYEVIVIDDDGYTQHIHPFVTHSDALHYYAQTIEGGDTAIYVNRESGEPVVTGLMTEPIVAWTTTEMRELFEVEEFYAPLVVVRRKSDGVKGTLQFTHSPRYYFAWVEGS